MIQAEQGRYPVSLMCRVLGVSRSGYYAWKTRPLSTKAQKDAHLLQRIRASFANSRHTYGSPRIHSDLIEEGEIVGHNRVARIMREHGITPKIKRKWVVTTDSNHDYPISPNLLNREFDVDAPNRVWVGDITYVRVYGKWTYLATVIDLQNRAVIGWAYESHMKTELVLKALEMAISQREVKPGLIFHSDRGSQYASHTFRKVLDDYEMISSMSRKGNCWDNAVAESFFSIIKRELLDKSIWRSQEAARAAIFEYIEVFYNRKRKHSDNGMMSPHKFENLYYEKAAMAA